MDRIKKRVVILYCSRKGGHRYPSQALYDYLKSNGQFEPQLFNLLDYLPLIPMLDGIGRLGDLSVPGLYRKGYHHLQKEDKGFTQVYKKSIQTVMTAPFVMKQILLLVSDADIVVSIQPEVNVIIPKLAVYIKARFHTVIIDYIIHRLWITQGISIYYVPNPELASDLVRFDISPEKIIVSGIPVREEFLKIMERDKEDIRRLLGIKTDLPTILVICGLLGTMMNFRKIISDLSNINTPCQIIVVFGGNEKARKDCEGVIKSSKWPIYTHSRVENMAELMWAADVVISKPGSVTIAEILSLGKPSILILPRAGSAQETAFGQFVQSKGASILMSDQKDIGKTVEELLGNRERMSLISLKAFNLGIYNRQANKIIADSLLENFYG